MSMNGVLKFPFYAKATLLLLGLYLLVSILSITQDILLPFIYAIILAILINPFVLYLESKKINRSVAIALVLIMAIILLGLLCLLLISQINVLTEAMPQLTIKFDELVKGMTSWAAEYFNIRASKVSAWIVDTKADLINNSGKAIGTTLSTIGRVLAATLLTPVYVFMILFYQNHIIEFVHRLFSAKQNIHVDEIFTETKTIIQSYLVGLFAEFAIISVLNCLGLLILGIPYAILLGVFGALLNIIPYIGGLIAVALFMIVALVTKTPVYALYVAGMYTVIQFIDNNYIVPKIIGSKVKLNALISILAVLSGAALWGIPGMFLAIPITAVIKLVLDRIKSLNEWGFLLGDTTSHFLKLKK